MSGVAVVHSVLAANGALTAVVAAARIIAGNIPINTALPAIEVRRVSGTPLNFIRNTGHNQAHTERIQVSALASTYPAAEQIMKLVLNACEGQRGSLGGVTCIDVVPDFQGPDLYNEAPEFHSQSRDFMVRWTP